VSGGGDAGDGGDMLCGGRLTVLTLVSFYFVYGDGTCSVLAERVQARYDRK